jgi:hypothetical protein
MRGFLSRIRGHSVFFLLCIILDFADPFTPGAWAFEADESIEAVSAPRPLGSPTFLVTSKPSNRVKRLESFSVTSQQRAPDARREWIVLLRRAHPVVADSPPPSEDH